MKYLAQVTISVWCERYLESSGESWDGHDRFQYTIMLLTIRAARFVHHVLVLSPELSRYHANDAEIVTRSQTKTWSFTKRCTKTTGHERFQYTMMQLVMLAARFVHHMWVLSPELSRYSLTGKFHSTRGEKSRMCAVHGGADRSSRRDLPRRRTGIRV